MNTLGHERTYKVTHVLCTSANVPPSLFAYHRQSKMRGNSRQEAAVVAGIGPLCCAWFAVGHYKNSNLL